MLKKEKEIKIICTVCPKSCVGKLHDYHGRLSVKGVDCKRGEKYLRREMTDPRRVFTSTVMVRDGLYNVVPVRTSKPIKKGDWKKAADIIYSLCLNAPLEIGHVIINDFLEKGINLVTTRNIPKTDK